MKNFIVRTITGVLFVAAIVTCFIRPEAMILLFALVTGLTVWEFTGLVNDYKSITVNRMICTVAGVYFFLAMAGYNSGLTPASVFIPYLVSIIYLLIAELYLKHPDPISNWAYTMMSQLYIALPFSLLNVLAFRSAGFDLPLDERYGCLSLWFPVRKTQALSPYLTRKELGRQHRWRYPRDGHRRTDLVSDR